MDMDFADFIEKNWNCRLLEYQKKLIREVEKHPDKYSIKLFPLSRDNQVRIVLVEKTEHEDVHSNHKGYASEIIFTDERTPEDRKDGMRKFIRRKK